MNDYFFREYLPERGPIVGPMAEESELDSENCLMINGYAIDVNALLEQQSEPRRPLKADYREAWKIALAAITR